MAAMRENLCFLGRLWWSAAFGIFLGFAGLGFGVFHRGPFEFPAFSKHFKAFQSKKLKTQTKHLMKNSQFSPWPPVEC
jgi:hypothetical protein